MTVRVAIIGAGVLGSAIGRQLARTGASVTLIDPAPGQGASAGSLAWLNASFASDPVYNALRKDSMALWRQLQAEHTDLPVRFPGSILFDDRDVDLAALTGPAPDQQTAVTALRSDEVTTLEPDLARPPVHSVHCPADGFGDPAAICDWFLDQAVQSGAMLRREHATQLHNDGGRITRVTTETGTLATDHVVLAAGIDLPKLLQRLGLAVAMANQPGLSVRTEPVNRRIQRILATPEGDLWQGDDGRILIANSPRDGETTDQAAARVEASLSTLFDTDIARETVTQRDRPIPADGRPAVGPLGPEGLYVVSMHSGMTLAPVMAEMVSHEIMTGVSDTRLAPYRPDRPALGAGP
ncbi:MAG: FAD-binding oxidoreductase [Pseudomonadota bacterium]